jgi:hypothetical protein
MARFWLAAAALALLLICEPSAAATQPSAASLSKAVTQPPGYRRMLRAEQNKYIERSFQPQPVQASGVQQQQNAYTANKLNNTQPSPSPHLAEGCYTDC